MWHGVAVGWLWGVVSPSKYRNHDLHNSRTYPKNQKLGSRVERKSTEEKGKGQSRKIKKFYDVMGSLRVSVLAYGDDGWDGSC